MVEKAEICGKLLPSFYNIDNYHFSDVSFILARNNESSYRWDISIISPDPDDSPLFWH